MAVRKSDLVRDALTKLAIIDYDYDIDPAEFRTGLIAMEVMMASWDARGIKCGYIIAPTPEMAKAEDDAGIPDIARRAIAYSLAIDIAPTYGKAITQEVAAGASSGMTDLLAAIQYLPTVQYPRNMPRGSGNTLRFNRWNRFYRPQQTLDADNAGPIDTGDHGALQP